MQLPDNEELAMYLLESMMDISVHPTITSIVYQMADDMLKGDGGFDTQAQLVDLGEGPTNEGLLAVTLSVLAVTTMIYGVCLRAFDVPEHVTMRLVTEVLETIKQIYTEDME